MRETAVDIFTGSTVDLREALASEPPAPEPTGDMAEFDQLPAWAPAPLREALYPFKAKDILPLVQTGTINRFNIGEMIRFNQARWRAYFSEKDRVDGLA